MPARDISIRNAHPRLKLDRRAVTRIITTLDQHRDRFDGGCPDGELSLAFLTDEEQAELHGRFLDDPTPTDVITFEGDPLFEQAGEICVSADTAFTYATKHGHDFAEELSLYVVHGWLHLAGYDDLEPALKRRMRAAEKRAMTILRELEALPAFRLA